MISDAEKYNKIEIVANFFILKSGELSNHIKELLKKFVVQPVNRAQSTDENILEFYVNAWDEHVELNPRFKSNDETRDIFKRYLEEEAYTTSYELLLVTWRDNLLRHLGHKVSGNSQMTSRLSSILYYMYHLLQLYETFNHI